MLSFGGFSLASGAERAAPLAAGELADRGDPLLGPLGALAPHRLDQRPVGLEDVVVGQRRRLVGDLVGAEGAALGGCHRRRLWHSSACLGAGATEVAG